MNVSRGGCVALGLVVGCSARLAANQPTPAQEKVDRALNTVLKPVAVATDAAVDVAVKTTDYVAEKWDQRPAQIREIMDLRLPGTLDKYNLTLDFEPRVGDLLRRNYVRFPLEARYGFSERWEGYGGLTPYTPNPFHSDPSGWGLGFFTAGLRYDVKPKTRLLGFDTVTLGTELRIPLGNPPRRMIDQYTHLVPSITTSRKLEHLPDTTFLLQLSYDSAQKWTNLVPIGIPERDILQITPALLYQPNEWGYFGQFAARHIRHDGETRLGSLSRAGVVWDIPPVRSRAWGLKGKWQIETAFEVETEEREETDFGIATRVRWKFDLKGARAK